LFSFYRTKLAFVSGLLTSTAEKTFAIVFETGDEAVESLKSFAVNNGVTAAHFIGITIEKEKPEKEKTMIHAHAVVARRDGTTAGGHLLEAHVRPTLDLVLTESPVHLERKFDKESGLPLIKI
jgi:uncharacterized protein